MSYFRKLWNKWFKTRTDNFALTQSLNEPRVASPTVLPPVPPRPSRNIGTITVINSSNFGGQNDINAIDPVAVTVAMHTLDNGNSVSMNIDSEVPDSYVSEPSSHLSPYESGVSGHCHDDSPSYSHQDGGYSHSDSGGSHSSSHSSYDSGSSSSYDSGSSCGCDGGGGGGESGG